ncbi:MAG TPA: tetratricopeptide repeat protein, partial [Pirellulaceae bacterium]|nr:tetratricopeptide repeat protein [Pirellulaceae bacterium]
SNEVDKIVVKLTADSGDQVQVVLNETGPHTGLFEGLATTGELPAGALATDTAIDHNPLMAIDRDEKSFWMSRPDGATPKSLTVDMKDLKKVSRVKITTPNAKQNAPVRADLLGSYDGEFWFKLTGHPAQPPVTPLALEYGPFKRRVYSSNLTSLADWQQLTNFIKSSKTFAEEPVAGPLEWKLAAEHEEAKKPAGVLWYGQFVQPKSGAIRFNLSGNLTALMLDGNLQLPLSKTDRTVDIWLDRGVHNLAIFSAVNQGQQGAAATRVRSDLSTAKVVSEPFRASDFDTTSATAKAVAEAAAEKPTAQPIALGIAAAQFKKKTEQFGVNKGTGNDKSERIGYWQSPEDVATWKFNVAVPGAYEVWFHWAHQGAGSKFKAEIGGQTIEAPVTDTGSWDNFRQERIGSVLLDAVGEQTLVITPVAIEGGGLMDLKGIELRSAVNGTTIITDNSWEFRFEPRDLRFTRLVVNEYLGEAVAINHVEVTGPEPDQKYIPTEADVLALALNEVLEIAGGDTVTATYADQITLSESGGSQLLESKLTATYYNALVNPIGYDFARNAGGDVVTTRKDLMRVDPGERVIVEITDYDADSTGERDTVKFQVQVNEGEPLLLEATETEVNTGLFTKEVDTTAKTEPGKLTIKPGDRIYIRYLDTQNTFPGHAVPREAIVFANSPTEGKVRILASVATPAGADKKGPPVISYPDTLPADETAGLAFEAPLAIEVIDPDAAKDSKSKVVVNVTTTDGATVAVECVISTGLKTGGQLNNARWALEEGRFIGQVIQQLGGKQSPDVVPLTANMPRQLIGGPQAAENAPMGPDASNLVARVLNITGKDIVTATYNDKLRPQGAAVDLAAKGRLVTAGELAVTDRDYEKPVTQLHVGERLYLLVNDADRDATDARDSVTIEIMTERGEKEVVELAETLAHSGVFTGSFLLKAVDKPTPGNLSPQDAEIESYFGDTLRIKYADTTKPGGETASGDIVREVPVVVGTDGLIAAFTKTFHDDNLAVETKFRIAESYFELFKSHKSLARGDEQKTDLEAGRRVLREVMEDYPDPQYAPRVAYLLGQFAQELQQWDEAIRAYETIIRQFPEHSLAADAQYKLAQAYEESGEFDQALEAYVTLAATYPKSPLIAGVMIRISDYFYKQEDYTVAAQVGEKFLEKFPDDARAPRMAFRVGQSFYKQKRYKEAGNAFDRFSKLFPDDALAADSFFWSGESFRMGGSTSEAFRRYNFCHWKHPSSEAAKYARGRLALPEMLQQFEAEARSAEDQ